MSINFDRALGIHETALGFRARRAEVLANNLANADTPNFKAKDLDFSAVLAEQMAKRNPGGNGPGGGGGAGGMPVSGSVGLMRTNSHHIDGEGFIEPDPALRYRTPDMPSIDQNTVDVNREQATYAENTIRFQASFTFLNSKFKGLTSALRGE